MKQRLNVDIKSYQMNTNLLAPMAEINMVPMIDIMLVLLVIFMVLAPAMVSSLAVDLPKVTHASQDKSHAPWTISIDAHQQIQLNTHMVDLKALELKLKDLTPLDRASQIVHIRADQKVAYGDVMNIISMCARLGYAQLRFLAVNETVN